MNIEELNAKIEQSRAKVAGWSMRDVLDYLCQRCETVEDYKRCGGSEDMNAVDARNRERATMLMAGRPSTVLPAPRSIHARYAGYIDTAQDRFLDRE